MRTIAVPVPGSPYEVHLGSGAFADIGEIAARTGAARVALVTQEHLATMFPHVASSLAAAGLEVVRMDIGDGEESKSWATVGALLELMAAAGMHRDDVLVALGGGVVTDTGGFAAASFLRGIRWIGCPTTVLGALDASIGGKTGCNLRAGKNLAGAFWQPSAVVVDTSAFALLPERQLRSGLAEAVKCGFIDDTAILDIVDPPDSGAGALSPAQLEEVVARGIGTKVRVVCADEREGGLRAILNYGHTLGHALETVCGYSLTHGEAISVGMVFAAELARGRSRLDDAALERHRHALSRLKLPVSAPVDDVRKALPQMQRDKKATAAGLRFVLLRGLGDATVVAGVGEAEIAAAAAAVSA